MKLSQVLLLSLVVTLQVSAIYPPVEKDPSIDSDELVTIQKLGSESGSKNSVDGLKKADGEILKNAKLTKSGDHDDDNDDDDDDEEDDDDDDEHDETYKQ
ncbi:unnamed protein product [[Candida] boidinii]|nr:unnamed protein product [[Candida] boidinii]